jgi:S1-C subfamily serine protease
MYRGALPHAFSLLLLGTALPARAGQDKATPLQNALALQQVVQDTIRAAEPAVACILVSRSEAYARYGQGPAPDNPGKLGALDPEALERYLAALSLDKQERDRIRRRLDLADPANVPESYGSGVVIDDRGLVLTNYHVVRGATKVFVRLPGVPGSYADVLAADPRSDLAVLRLLAEGRTYKALPLGDGGKAERGQFVVALANPFAAGFRDARPGASFGVVSNVRRRPAPARRGEGARPQPDYGVLVETDTRLHAGCSGGALLNLKGELIGLTTALAAVGGGDAPANFAVPLDAGLARVIDVLKQGREVEYGFLGVRFGPGAPGAGGVALSEVTPGSPADRKGLRDRDVILAVNGTPVGSGDDLSLALRSLLAGADVTLDVRKARGGQRLKVQVRLAKYYVPGKKVATSLAPRPFFRGLRVDYTSLLVQQEPWAQTRQRIPAGVLVGEVQPNSPAATALLRPGEVITHVNNRPVDTPAAFYQEVAGRTGPVELTLAGGRPGRPAPKVVLN